MSEPCPQEPLPISELQLELAHFTGTESYHCTHPGLLATGGAKYLADEAGAYWLLDVIWSVLLEITDDFAVLELTVSEGSGLIRTDRLRDGYEGCEVLSL